ncbi:MAG: Crp/Fnr family transcriptional regulator [Acidobacteriia bacterium]|nr:Crp/Fnr family transcriptional regulator [Terriglobia bacterium]
MQAHQLQIVDSCRTCRLRASSFFCDLSPTAIAAFEAIKITIPYYAGALLFNEGDQARGVYVLCQGRVKLTIGSEGRTLVVAICNPGQVLGLPSCISNLPNQFTAEVMEPCQVNFARREDFLRFLESHPDASLRVAQRVSENLHDVMDLIHTVGLAHSATERMARFFLLLSSGADTMETETRLNLAFTQRELAQTIGATRETACRVLGIFKKMNVVSLQGSTLVIQDRAALRELARVDPAYGQ